MMYLSVLALALVAMATAVDIQGPMQDTVALLETFPGYKGIWRTGDTAPLGGVIGQLYNMDMSPMDITSPNPDFSSLHVRNQTVYGLHQFESPSPAAFYSVEYTQNASTGALSPKKFTPVDFSAWGGLWVPCAGSMTPWGTHAGGEEYEPDAGCWALTSTLPSLMSCARGLPMFVEWLGGNASDYASVVATFNPYLYGYGFEVTLDAMGVATSQKWYTLGRHSYELYIVMPDNKTVYSTDDGTGTSFFKFVMDIPGDMSSGSLYGAKLFQQSALNGGDFVVSWIRLGHGTQMEIKAIIDSGIMIMDIFDIKLATVVNGTASCSSGFKTISARDNGIGKPECLKLRSGMEKAAAFLESRRYLSYLGGTAELSKWEGITYEPNTHKLYGAMSQVRYGMEDNMKRGGASTQYDAGGPNDVRLPYNPCGCVMACDLDANYDVIRMYAEVCGIYTVEQDNNGRNLGVCDVAGISEPDNVVTMNGQATLIIGEDTGTVENDGLWQYDLMTKTLKRIFSTPYGSETTAPWWTDDINGWSYLSSAIQHPYGESGEDKVDEPESTGTPGHFGAWSFRTAELKSKSSMGIQFIEIEPAYMADTEGHRVRAASAAFLESKKKFATNIAMPKMN